MGRALILTLVLASAAAGWCAEPSGRYWLDAETSVEIDNTDGRLTLTLSDHEPCLMVKMSDGRYAVPALAARLDASRDGEIVSLTRYGATMKASRQIPSPSHARNLYTAIRDKTPVWMARYNVPGVGIAVIRNRRTVWHAELGVRAATGDEPITEDSVFEACSMSKALFAYAVLKLVEEGRLDLDRPLDAYLPSPYLPDQPEAGRITARMVLAHTTGLPNWRPGGWLRGGPLKLIARPGEKWTYSGEGFTYLQAVVEHLTGEAINDWMQHVLMRPLGMARSSYEWRDEYETSYAMGHNREGELKNFAHYRRGNTAFSLYTTPVEYSRLLCAMMAPRPRGAHMLSNAMREAMLVPQSRKDETTRCGLAWHIHEGEDGRYYFHGGANGAGFRCISRFDPTDGSGIVVMTNSDSGVEVYKRVVELWESRS